MVPGESATQRIRHRVTQGRVRAGPVVGLPVSFAAPKRSLASFQRITRRVLAPAIARAAEMRAERGDSILPPQITPHTLRRTFVTLSAQLGRSASWVQSQIGHADMTTMQRYYLQASRSEIQPRIQNMVGYLLGDASTPAGDGGPTATDQGLQWLLEGAS